MKMADKSSSLESRPLSTNDEHAELGMTNSNSFGTKGGDNHDPFLLHPP